jgi:hypothetical protein
MLIVDRFAIDGRHLGRADSTIIDESTIAHQQSTTNQQSKITKSTIDRVLLMWAARGSNPGHPD